MRYFLVCLIIICFFSCKKKDANSVDLLKEYYPLEIGFWQEYQVDSISFNDFTTPITIDTNSYFIKEIVESAFLDLNNEENLRIEKFTRNDSTSWSIDQIFSAKVSDVNLQKVENDLRFIKLVFPPKENKTWNGNIYIDAIDEATLEYYNPKKYSWEYVYLDVHEAKTVGNFSFDSTVTIIQIDDENLFEKKYSKEIYAKNIGLVYKELMILETQTPPNGQSFMDRVEKGFILKYTISDYKQ